MLSVALDKYDELFFFLSEIVRVCPRASGDGGEAEGARILSRLHTWHGAQRGARSHNLETTI